MFSKRLRQGRVRPQWIAQLDAIENTIHDSGRLFVIQGLTEDNFPRPKQVWPSAAIRIYEADCRTGAIQPLEGSTQPVEGTLDVGTGRVAGSCLYVNYGNRVVGWDLRRPGKSMKYRVISGATVTECPVTHEGSLVCLWKLAHSEGAQVTREDHRTGSFSKSEVLEGQPYHPMIWAGARIVVTTRCPSPPQPGHPAPTASDRFSTRLYLIDPVTLKVKASSEGEKITGKEAILVHGDQVYYASERYLQFKPDGEWQNLAPEASSDGEARVTGYQRSGSYGMTWLSCLTAQELRPLKSWRLSGQCTYLTSLPGHPAIVATAQPGVFDTAVEVLLNSRPRPAPIGSWAGETVCAPEFVNERGYWLTNVESVSWLEERIQAETGEAQLAARDHDTQIHTLDFSRGEHRVLALALGEEPQRLFVHNNFIILQTASALVAYNRDELWDAAESLHGHGLAGVARALGSSAGSASLSGALFSGPLQEDWGYQHRDATLHETVDNLLESSDVFWLQTESDRLKAIAAITDELVKSVLMQWPDTPVLEAQACPADFFRHACAADPKLDTPFGRLDVNRALTDRILRWRQQEESIPEELPPGVAERIARFLLHEHIRRCISSFPLGRQIEEWRDRHVIDLRSSRSFTPAFASAVAWYSLENVEPKFARRFLETFATQWSDGTPSWEGSVDPYIEFLRDCARWGLLCQPAYNSLSEAVCRAWCSALNPCRKSVFISYSHRHEEIAHYIAGGLKQRGLGVALDRWEIGADSDDYSVEAWIAESIMGSEVKIFLLSSEALLSGWVNREIEWELRLLGARRGFSLPYVLIPDESTPLSLEAYPRGRLVPVGHIEGKHGNTALDELALRIAFDGILQVQTAGDGVLRGFAM